MHYLICGLSVSADMPLPGVWRTDPVDKPDVIIRVSSIPRQFDDHGSADRIWSVTGQDFLLKIPGLMRLLVHGGRDMVVEPAAGVAVAETVPFILSTGIGAILHQRNILALHAATVAWQGQGIALCGQAGIGKSTMAATLCQIGAQFLGDDVAAVRMDGGGRPLVYPDGRQHRLWADAVAHLDLTSRRSDPVRLHLDKFHVSPDQGAEADRAPLPLSTIVLLRDRPHTAPPAPPEIQDLPLVDALPLLRAEVFRPKLAERMEHAGRLFTQIAGLLGHVRVLRLQRTRSLADLRSDAQLLLSRIAEAR